MKAKYIQTKLIHLNKAYWIKLKPSAFKQCLLNQMKAKCIQTMLTDSNKAYWIKWKPSVVKQS